MDTEFSDRFPLFVVVSSTKRMREGLFVSLMTRKVENGKWLPIFTDYDLATRFIRQLGPCGDWVAHGIVRPDEMKQLIEAGMVNGLSGVEIVSTREARQRFFLQEFLQSIEHAKSRTEDSAEAF